MLLESMKKGVSKIVIQILAVLLIASFALWGVGDMVGVISNPDEVAKIGENRVTQREFQERFRRTLEQARQTVGNIDAEGARALGLADLTLDNLLAERLLSIQAADLGVLISDEQIAENIRRNPGFRNSLGEFDRAAFQAVLANSGMTEAAYVETLRQELQRQYLGNIVGTEIVPPSQLADTIYKFRNEQRSVEMVQIENTSMKSPPPPPDTELAQFLQENQDSFMSPEYRRITILHLDPEEVARELSPSEDRIREEYDGRLDSLVVPERRRLEQILAKTEDMARQMHAAASEGKPFAEIVSGTGGAASHVRLGSVTQNDLPAVIGDATFVLPQGGVTTPVQSPIGWHVVRVEEIVPGRTPPLDEVREQIKNDLARELALDDLVRRANKIEDAQAGGATLEQASIESGTRPVVLDPIDASGRTKSGNEETRLPQDRQVLEVVFTTEPGETSDLVETDSGGYFILRVDEIIDPALPALDQIRAAVVDAWKSDQRDQEARKKAEELLNLAKRGQPLGDIASSKRLKFSSGGPTTRIPQEETSIPPALLDPMFEAREREPFIAPLPDGYALATVTGITQAVIDRQSEEYSTLARSLSASLSNDLLGEYTRSLREDYDVVINRQALDAFFAARR